MASPSSSSAVIFIVLAVSAAIANAATFTVTNRCGFTVWPAAIPVGGGVQLNPGQSWRFGVPAGTSSGRVWGRTGCSFNGGGRSCQTGDCGGALSCRLSGRPPATLAEFTIGGGAAHDYYDISVIDGYNVAMDFSCSSGVALRCRDSNCPDAYHQPNDRKTNACNGNSDYQITFCP
ncbi:hypothetical protein PR202_gb24373 [Eleusine coracana subsp. coracana]|uniref:Thaumatin-like protein n=1 Tax=Eleusine coracana subsp. coracana TaxID=191504 RepID=A0AAV5FKW4_ELECO|nr:hypothetical protein QOZ80_5BG0447670 [Eleusine coracana subsp. coracana]GJN35582.1 hypothetical protein PR202_gb24373 [Eleusine coracana subsp. coracana]